MPQTTDHANHGPLNAWLIAHDARCLWVAMGSPRFDIEGWTINAAVLIVTRYHDGGWDIFTACQSLGVDQTFADAEKRLQLPEPRIGHS